MGEWSREGAVCLEKGAEDLAEGEGGDVDEDDAGVSGEIEGSGGVNAEGREEEAERQGVKQHAAEAVGGDAGGGDEQGEAVVENCRVESAGAGELRIEGGEGERGGAG
jgi:hypothetical protein